jgi:phosphoribosylglycinamide formyltransferase-1
MAHNLYIKLCHFFLLYKIKHIKQVMPFLKEFSLIFQFLSLILLILFMESRKIAIGVLASGRGSNFQAIIDAVKAGTCAADIKVLITNKPDAYAIERARKNNIPVETLDRKQFETREQMDDHIRRLLERYDVELVVLAGYMLLLKGKELLDAYKNKIINIHPALLPSFPGVDAQTQAFNHGVKVSGITIHFVDADLDAGPIIYQEAVDISDCKDAEETGDRILKAEHSAYPKIIDSFAKGKYKIQGRRVLFIRGEK